MVVHSLGKKLRQSEKVSYGEVDKEVIREGVISDRWVGQYPEITSCITVEKEWENKIIVAIF